MKEVKIYFDGSGILILTEGGWERFDYFRGEELPDRAIKSIESGLGIGEQNANKNQTSRS